MHWDIISILEKFFHPYHMVNMSPWPLLAGFGALSVVIGMIKMFSFFKTDLLFFSLMLMIVVSLLWWRDVVREGTFQGFPSSTALGGLMVGMILFIVSNVFFLTIWKNGYCSLQDEKSKAYLNDFIGMIRILFVMWLVYTVICIPIAFNNDGQQSVATMTKKY